MITFDISRACDIASSLIDKIDSEFPFSDSAERLHSDCRRNQEFETDDIPGRGDRNLFIEITERAIFLRLIEQGDVQTMPTSRESLEDFFHRIACICKQRIRIQRSNVFLSENEAGPAADLSGSKSGDAVPTFLVESKVEDASQDPGGVVEEPGDDRKSRRMGKCKSQMLKKRSFMEPNSWAESIRSTLITGRQFDRSNHLVIK